MVKDYTERAFLIFLVSPAFVYFSYVAILVRKSNPTHPHGDIALNETGRSLRNYGTPAFDTETAVEWVFIMVTHKV